MYGFFHAGYEKNQAGMSLHRVGEPLIKPRHRAARKSAFQKRIRVGMYSVGDSLPEDRLPGRPMPRRWDRARRLHELRGILFAVNERYSERAGDLARPAADTWNMP